jgi:hypothetical protein
VPHGAERAECSEHDATEGDANLCMRTPHAAWSATTDGGGRQTHPHGLRKQSAMHGEG